MSNPARTPPETPWPAPAWGRGPAPCRGQGRPTRQRLPPPTAAVRHAPRQNLRLVGGRHRRNPSGAEHLPLQCVGSGTYGRAKGLEIPGPHGWPGRPTSSPEDHLRTANDHGNRLAMRSSRRPGSGLASSAGRADPRVSRGRRSAWPTKASGWCLPNCRVLPGSAVTTI